MTAKSQILLRYLLLAVQMLLGFLSMETGDYLRFTLLILIFINNHLRHYVLDSKTPGIVVSFFAELVLLAAFGFNTTLYLAIALWPLCYDSALSTWLSLRHRLIAAAIILVFATVMSPDPLLANAVCLAVLVFSFLIVSAKNQAERRTNDYLEADNERQQLRDKLELTEHERAGREELAILRERNRISRDIHDSVGHSLSTMVIQLQAIELLAEKDPQAAAEMARNLGDFGRASLEKIREALRELKPESYSAYELVLMLDDLCRQTEKLSGMVIFFRYSGEIRQLGQDQGQALYWVTKEFLTNSSRHGQAKHAWLHLHFRTKELVYNLEDDGVGFDTSKSLTLGIGMRGMRERVAESQGTWEWWSPEQKGFHMKIVMPLQIGE